MKKSRARETCCMPEFAERKRRSESERERERKRERKGQKKRQRRKDMMRRKEKWSLLVKHEGWQYIELCRRTLRGREREKCCPVASGENEIECLDCVCVCVSECIFLKCKMQRDAPDRMNGAEGINQLHFISLAESDEHQY